MRHEKIAASLPLVTNVNKFVKSGMHMALKLAEESGSPDIRVGAAPSRTMEVSVKGDLASAWAAVLGKCRVLLMELAARSPRYVKLYGDDGNKQPMEAALAVQDDICRDKSSSPPTIENYVKDTKCSLA